MADKVAEDRVVEGIDLLVRKDDFLRQFRVAGGVGGQNVVDHLAGNFGHGGKQGERFELLAVVADLAARLGDVLGIVADTLDHAGDLQCGDDFAQIVRHRRTQRDDAHGQLVDLAFERVDLLVAFDDLLGEVVVTAHQRIERLLDRDFGQTAHFRDQAAEAGDVFVEGFYGMFLHVLT